MKTKELKLSHSQIGNSRGVRIPASTLKRYHMGATVLMDELADGIMLRPGSRRVRPIVVGGYRA